LAAHLASKKVFPHAQIEEKSYQQHEKLPSKNYHCVHCQTSSNFIVKAKHTGFTVFLIFYTKKLKRKMMNEEEKSCRRMFWQHI